MGSPRNNRWGSLQSTRVQKGMSWAGPHDLAHAVPFAWLTLSHPSSLSPSVALLQNWDQGPCRDPGQSCYFRQDAVHTAPSSPFISGCPHVSGSSVRVTAVFLVLRARPGTEETPGHAGCTSDTFLLRKSTGHCTIAICLFPLQPMLDCGVPALPCSPFPDDAQPEGGDTAGSQYLVAP